MLPYEIQAAIANDPRLQAGYQNFQNWIGAGAQHGSYAGMMPNEAVVRREQTPWGEGLAYDAAGNVVSEYRAPRAGELSPYGGNVAPGSGGPSAPEWTPAQMAAFPVPHEYTQDGIVEALARAGKPNPFLNALASDISYDPMRGGGFVAK